jgi:tetratricopeptide (TPR) repeat protein
MASHAYTDAKLAFDKALALATDMPAAAQLAIYLQLIRACEVTGDQAEQEAALKVALPLAKSHGDPALLIPLLMEQGYFEMKQGAYDAAEACLRDALALAESTNDVATQGTIQERLGDMALRLGENVRAVELFETAVTIAQQTNNLPLEARSLDGIGYALCQHSRPLAEYAPYFEKAIALHKQSGNPFDEARTLVSYFSTLQNGGAWDRVLRMADDVIAAQQAIDYRRGEAIAYQAYGLAAGQLGDYALADDSLNKALAGFNAVGEPLGATIATTVLGSMAHRQGKVEAATAYFKDALALARQMESRLFIAMAQRDWSSLLVEKGEWETAVTLLEEAIAIWIEQSDKLSQCRCETLLGLAYVGLGKLDEAHTQAQAGWDAFQEFDKIFGEERELWLWDLAQLCEKVGMVEETAVLVRAAYNELQTHAHIIEDHAIRHRFFANVPPNRAIVKAYDQQENIQRTQQVSLAHKDVPLGRSLTADDLIAVNWTILAPEDEAISNKTERRQAQLKRLLTEAAAQNATPTDDDLATTLNVSRRTIIRDMQALAASGSTWQTRGRG